MKYILFFTFAALYLVVRVFSSAKGAAVAQESSELDEEKEFSRPAFESMFDDDVVEEQFEEKIEDVKSPVAKNVVDVDEVDDVVEQVYVEDPRTTSAFPLREAIILSMIIDNRYNSEY